MLSQLISQLSFTPFHFSRWRGHITIVIVIKREQDGCFDTCRFSLRLNPKQTKNYYDKAKKEPLYAYAVLRTVYFILSKEFIIYLFTEVITMNGKVLLTKNDKALILAGNKYYVIKNKDYQIDDEVEFAVEEALLMPSYLFAIAAIEEENLDDTLDFIQEEWFRNHN